MNLVLMDLKHLQRFFESLAVDAAQRYIHTKNITGGMKSDSTPVTKADLDINSYVIERIEKEFPGIPILSEELKDRGDRLNSRNSFIVDPVDGTAALQESKGISDLEKFVRFVDANGFTLDRIDKRVVDKAGYSVEGVRALLKTRTYHFKEEAALSEFARRIEEYAVLLGYEKDGKSACGVCYMPATGEMYTASKGNGAFKIVDGIRTGIHTSGKDSRIVVGRYNIDDDLKRILAEHGTSLDDVAFGGSMGVKVCWVAEGKYDRFIQTNLSADGPHASLWDSCAVDIILYEAGGSSYDFDGQSIDYKSDVPLVDGYVAVGKSIDKDFKS